MAKNPHHSALRSSQRGVTLIESLIVTVITAITAGIAVPSFEQARERQHLEGAAAQMRNDLQFTRSLAVARNETLRLSFFNGPDSTCYVIHAGAAADCECAADGSAVCTGDPEILRVARMDGNSPISVRSNSRSIVFDAVKGTISPTATLQLQARGGSAIHQIVNVMGRVRTCSPAPALPGFRPC